MTADYWQKIQDSEILYCEDHDIEYLDGEECYACRDERQYFLAEQGDVKAQEWVRPSMLFSMIDFASSDILYWTITMGQWPLS